METLKIINPEFFNDKLEMFHLFTITAMTATTFFVLFYAGDIILGKIIQFNTYVRMNWKDRADFLSRITAQLHALVSAFVAY